MQLECYARLPASLYQKQPSSNVIPWIIIEQEGKELLCRALPAENDKVSFVEAKSFLWRPAEKSKVVGSLLPRLRIAESIRIDRNSLTGLELSELRGKLVHKPIYRELFIEASFGRVKVLNAVASPKSPIKDGSCEFMLFAPQAQILFSVEEASKENGPKKLMTPPVGLEVPFRQLTDLLNPLLIAQMRRFGFELPKGVLMSGPPGVGKTFLVRQIAENSGFPLIVVNGPELLSSVPGESEASLKEVFQEAQREAKNSSNQAAIVFFDEIDAIARKREEGNTESLQELRLLTLLLTLMDGFEQERDAHVLVFAATNRPNALDPAMRRPGRFDREILFEPPDAPTRTAILQELCKQLSKDSDVDFDELGRVCVGFVGADLAALVREAQRAAEANNIVLNKLHFKEALGVVGPSLHRQYAIPLDKRVTWSSIAGIDAVRDEIRRFIEWPLKHANVFNQMGLTPPKGVLLYGPPGCSKTTIAKAIANESGFTFYSLTGASLYSCFVGESESQIREIFHNARLTAPSLIFFDEIDSIVGKRSREFGQGSGDVVQERILSTLLNEMDGISSQQGRRPVLVVGATNRKDLIDEALLRPGRFDRHIYIPKPSTAGRRQILELFLSGRAVEATLDLDALAERTEGFSGADLKGLVQEAGLLAMHDGSFTFKADHFEQIFKKPGRSRKV